MTGDVDRRIAALGEAVGLAEGRLEPDAVAAARRVTEKAGARLGLGLDRTVVALAGPTGAGKSQLFNTLTGTELAMVSRRRPTTGEGLAASWGEGADALLDWLEIKRRHRLEPGSLGGLVLLDLPDFDSVEVAHRLEVERVIELVDLVLWVVDPQKYADAALHDRYLRKLTGHGAMMALVVNQADLLTGGDTDAVRRDAERLLVDDGLAGMPALVVSALTHDGIDGLMRLLAERVAAREAAVTRLAADAASAADALRPACAGPSDTGIAETDRQRLVAALAEAAGVPRVIEAVGAAHRRRGTLATGWPPTRWLRRIRPDPLKRLHLEGTPTPARTSLPPPTDVQRAQVATAVRALADGASAGLAAPWPRIMRKAVTTDEERIVDRLDRAVGSAQVEPRRPRWWRLAAVLQWLLLAIAAVGGVWIGLAGLAGWLRIEDVVPLPELSGVPIPTWLVLGGLLGGLVLTLLARLANRVGAARRRRAAERVLRPEIEAVAQELVLEPVERELDARAKLCRALALASGRKR